MMIFVYFIPFRFRKMIMNFPEPLPDLNFAHNLYYSRNCYKCAAPNQKSILNIERYNFMIMMYMHSILTLIRVA